MDAERSRTSALTPLELGFDPGDVGFVADPYPVYERLRAQAPIIYDEATDHWLVTRYDDVNALLRDRRFGRTYLHVATHEEMGRPAPPPALDPFWHLINHGILDMEPPDHTRVRRLASKAFTPRMVESMRRPVQRLTDELVDAVEGTGEFDLLSAIAEPLPVAVIAELLGVPSADRHLLRPWSADICRMYELHPTEDDMRIASRASTEFSDYLRALSRSRRDAPAGDLISELALVVDEGERLTEDELIGTCVLLLNAGHEATVNVTGNGWWALFRNPAALDRLRAEPELVPPAIEELMRWDTPLQLFERWVLEDVEVHGVRVPKGAELGLVFGSANRDPAVFDAPDELRIDRDPNPHLTFGAGIHFCLGAPLARLELQTSFATVLRRLPTLEPADEPRWKPGYIIRGLGSMRVRC
ncbi:MAG TPA: cytochrome P450 [Actinomycetota bacterium]|nr:cytochrome P450 [Actinomycetota bacterium]